MTGLADRRVLITGGGSGIGAATAAELAHAGARVAIVDRDAKSAAAVASELSVPERRVLYFTCDVRRYQELAGVLHELVETWGGIDAVIASAGIADDAPVLQGDPELWREVLETNALGVFNALRASAEHMVARGAGDLVAIASVSARIAYVGQPAYIASKHAVAAFGECLRKELAPTGVRVTLIEPGLVDTPLSRTAPVVDDLLSEVQALRPEDCARAIRYAITQPPGCGINEIVLRPVSQVL